MSKKKEALKVRREGKPFRNEGACLPACTDGADHAVENPQGVVVIVVVPRRCFVSHSIVTSHEQSASSFRFFRRGPRPPPRIIHADPMRDYVCRSAEALARTRQRPGLGALFVCLNERGSPSVRKRGRGEERTEVVVRPYYNARCGKIAPRLGIWLSADHRKSHLGFVIYFT